MQTYFVNGPKTKLATREDYFEIVAQTESLLIAALIFSLPVEKGVTICLIPLRFDSWRCQRRYQNRPPISGNSAFLQ